MDLAKRTNGFWEKRPHLRIGSRKVGGLVLQKTPPFAE
ncbi:hypothetical protein B4100_2624 [Heyndrickxia coagulans]|nr:hypothetical protein B4100_2624 [Heyndrickxia coagulans]